MDRQKLLLAAASLALVSLLAWQLRRRLAPAPRDGESAEEVGSAEPVLGYDGMDLDTLIEWLEQAELDEIALRRIQRYESANRRRESVLETIEDLLRAQPQRR